MSVHTEEKLCPDCLPEITLGHGSHADRSGDGGGPIEICVEEAVAWAAGEPHSDRPTCVSPVIVSAMIRANDNMRSNEERDRWLKPLIFIQLGTNTGRKDDEVRAWLTADWVVRTCAPAWFDLVPALSEAGQALRALTPLTDRQSYEAAQGMIDEARERASEARRAAWKRIRSAAANAAADAAANAAADAAAYAADAAAYVAAAYAADAADAAAYAADAAAAKERVREKREEMWDSFSDLIRRMCAVGRPTEITT